MILDVLQLFFFASGGRSGSITDVTYSGILTAAVVTTAAEHGLSTGARVSLAGTSHFNGTWTITVIDSTSFSLDGSTDAGDSSGGNWFQL